MHYIMTPLVTSEKPGDRLGESDTLLRPGTEIWEAHFIWQ